MKSMKRLLWIIVTFWFGATPCRSDFLLKPKGQNAAPLRLKALDAKARIVGQFARTQLNYTFQNETGERMEADFLCTVPQGSVVTYFAYWYGDERVVARVVEKERAAQIYKYITSRMRDPALVEMLDKNLFRARIFPVMPNADLNIEVHLAQTLGSDKTGAVYVLPLRTPKGSKDTLERLAVSIQAEPGSSAAFSSVSNNYDLPVAQENGVYTLNLAKSNCRPAEDLEVHLKRAPQPMRATLFAKRSAGSDGFFALALTPNVALRKPHVAIQGIKTWQLSPQQLPRVAANGTLEVTGRYRGSGPASVKVSDGVHNWILPLVFGNEAENNHIATKLWAANRITELSHSTRNRQAVIALSQRFTLPSKWTSWLAIPQEERATFKEQMMQAEFSLMGQRIAMQFANGHGKSRTTRQLRQKFNSLAQKLGEQPSEALPTYFDVSMRVLASQLAQNKYSARPNRTHIKLLRRQLDRLRRAGAGRDSNGLEPIYIVEEDMRELGRQILDEVMSGRSEGKRAKALRAALQKMEGRAQKVGLGWSADTALQDVASQRLPLLDSELASEQAKQNANSGKVAVLQQRRDRVAQLVPPPMSYRSGDPLISVVAPADAAQVVALLPGGEIKPLVFNGSNGHWEARFDIPTHAATGNYVITVIMVNRDGSRRTLTLHYMVDANAPHGANQSRIMTADEPLLRLQMRVEGDTARVTALLPWGDRAELRPVAAEDAVFGAQVLLPAEWRGRAVPVTFILTDRAHNRTLITVDMNQ